ncbi:hypothetical protein JG688_00016301 [Phytophthora aleatoria]|uniref:Uncharacterized protein n=1 Tax=Phytophthora aleatoria TaxID=2496075 RepID=A0A8J5ICL9_9STRA|nr:hypothetical protein JG688_00016301 [Phytophthora aleatoria]
MAESRKAAKQLVQRTITSYNTNQYRQSVDVDIQLRICVQVLSSFTAKTMGPRKQPIAKVVAPNECLKNVKFVLDEKLTKKCKKLRKIIERLFRI